MRKIFNNYNCMQKFLGICFLSTFLFLATTLSVFSRDLGNGFFDHGVPTPVSSSRGTVATVDGNGRNVVLVWLFDHRGVYSLLMIDAETGRSEQFPTPFPAGDAVYSSILSSKNKYYTLFNSYFVEFDPVKRAFTFDKKTLPADAMGMTEDDKGVIWAVTYPNSGVVSFDPAKREFRDYGYVNKQNWRQYPSSVAADKAGWIYFGIGNTASQIVAFNSKTSEIKPLLSESERKRGSAYVYKDTDGKVYGQALKSANEEWYELNNGEGTKIGKNHSVSTKQMVAGNQGLFYRDFPDGKKLMELNLIDRKLVVEDPKTGSKKEVLFEYTSDGGWTMGIAASPDGKICGGTSFPMRFFSFDPKNGSWVNLPAFGQLNALTRQGDRIYFGAYGGGCLLEWDPSRPWVNTQRVGETNPLFLAGVSPVINRPSRVFAHPDGKTIIMSGTPQYGYTGGGLLFFDRGNKTQTLLQDSAVILDQSTMSLVALPEGKLLGGTTTAPGTGGEKKAKAAELYIMDMASKRVEWHQPVLPSAQDYSDMCVGPDGLIYGVTDYKDLFVFDPVKREVVFQSATAFGRTAAEQSPRIFISGPKKEIYLLFVKGIAKIEPGSFRITMVAESPVPITTGGDCLDGRIYFISGSHLCSYKL